VHATNENYTKNFSLKN